MNFHQAIFYFLFGAVIFALLWAIRFARGMVKFLHIAEHELSHGVVAKLFGGRVAAIQISDRGGAILTTRSNLIIRLAPYALPLFALISLIFTFVLAREFQWFGLVVSGTLYANYLFHLRETNFGIQPDIRRSGGKLVAFPLIIAANVATCFLIGAIIRKIC